MNITKALQNRHPGVGTDELFLEIDNKWYYLVLSNWETRPSCSLWNRGIQSARTNGEIPVTEALERLFDRWGDKISEIKIG